MDAPGFCACRGLAFASVAKQYRERKRAGEKAPNPSISRSLTVAVLFLAAPVHQSPRADATGARLSEPAATRVDWA